MRERSGETKDKKEEEVAENTKQQKIVYRQRNNKSEYKHGINYMHELTGVKRSLKIQSFFFSFFCLTIPIPMLDSVPVSYIHKRTHKRALQFTRKIHIWHLTIKEIDLLPVCHF